MGVEDLEKFIHLTNGVSHILQDLIVAILGSQLRRHWRGCIGPTAGSNGLYMGENQLLVCRHVYLGVNSQTWFQVQ